MATKKRSLAFLRGYEGCVRSEFVRAQLEILERIHIRNECFVRCVVRVEIFVHIAIVEPFGTHIVEMVGGLKTAPVVDKLGIAGSEHVVLKLVHTLERIVLHRIGKPRGEVALHIRPRHIVVHIELGHRLIARDRLGWCHEIIVGMLIDLLGQMTEEVEDARILPLVLAKGLIVHKEVDEVPVAINLRCPLCKLGRGERKVRPVL